MKRFPYLTLLGAGLTLVVHGSPTLTDGLQLQREAIAQGQVWRVLTGHFTHFGANHLKWDVIAFLLLGSLVEVRSRFGWVLCVGVGAFAISVGVMSFQPRFTHYRGLSGLDSAFFAYLSFDRLRLGWQARDGPLVAIAFAAGVGFMAKTLYEMALGETLFVDPAESFEPVPLAHLAGAGVGALVAWGDPLRIRRTATQGPLKRPSSVSHGENRQRAHPKIRI